MAKRKPGDSQPYLNHETLTQEQQARFLGRKDETVMNLGHPMPESRLTENPAGRPINYEPGTERTFRDPARLQGVYRKCDDPRSGIAQQQNLERWSGYASANSYDGHHHVAGPGKPPSMPDSRPDHRASQESDGYLESTKRWPTFEYGSESGPGRIEKQHKR